MLFDKSFIGGSNLGGRCTLLRGAIVDFKDIFNLEKDCNWSDYLVKRDDNSVRYGWDGYIKPF